MADSIFDFTLHTVADVEVFLRQPGAVVYAPHGKRCNIAFLQGCIGVFGFSIRPEALAAQIENAQHRVLAAPGYEGVAGRRLEAVSIPEPL